MVKNLEILNPLSYERALEKLQKQKIIHIIQFYGFIECKKIMDFLSVIIDGDIIDVAAFKYLHSLLNECIKNHAEEYVNKSVYEYFLSLINLRDEIEYIISIAKY